MKLIALLTSVAALALTVAAPNLALAQDAEAAAPAAAIDIIRRATDLPGPLTANSPRHHVVGLETTEVIGQLENGTSYTY